MTTKSKSSPPLSNLQSWLRGILTYPKGVGAALQSSKKYLHVIGETPSVNRETRLSIYGNGYFWRIIDVLAANYVSVKNAMGEDDFYPLARQYLVKHPSTFKSIDDIGGELSSFLKHHPLTKKWPFLPDLARIEWSAHRSFFADNLPLLDPKHFKNIPEASWLKARFQLDPSVQLLKLNWPVDKLWRVDGKWPKSRLRRMKKEPLCILVFRQPDKWVRVPRISVVQFELLSQLAQNKPLGKVLLALVKKRMLSDEVIPVQAWFQEWIEDGVFKKIEYN